MVLPLHFLKYFLKQNWLIALIYFSKKVFLHLFVLEIKSKPTLYAKSTPKSEHDVSWLLNILQFKGLMQSLLKKKKKEDWSVRTTKRSLTVMNYFTPLEGFPWLILYASILSPSLLSTPLFSKPQNPLMTELFAFHFTSQHPPSTQHQPTPRRCQHCLCGVGNNTLPLLVNLHQIRPGLGSSVRSVPPFSCFPPSLLKNLNYSF